ncbi:MAG: Crp/Fnr family transcriptional regulator [Chloroflexota bacterium]
MLEFDQNRLTQDLHSLVYFETLSPDQLAWLAAQTIRRRFETGEMIFLEGEPAAGLWFIEAGRVKIFKLNPDGEEHILHFLGTGNTFNDIAALDGGLNPANAAALSEVSVWLVPSGVLGDLLVGDGQVALKVVRILAGRVRTLVQQIEDLALYSVTIRLARFLLKQTEDPALSGPGVTRAAIAAHLATKPETVSRALRTLEENRAIRFDRHRILITNENLLRTIAAL